MTDVSEKGYWNISAFILEQIARMLASGVHFLKCKLNTNTHM